MDQVHRHLHKSMRGRVVVPCSIPGLVTKRVMVMDYLPGLPISQLASRTAHLPARVKAAASNRVCSRKTNELKLVERREACRDRLVL